MGGGPPSFFADFRRTMGGGGYVISDGLWGWLVARRATMGGGLLKKNRPEGPIFWRRRRLWAAKPPKIGPPLGEGIFFRKIFYSGKSL